MSNAHSKLLAKAVMAAERMRTAFVRLFPNENGTGIAGQKKRIGQTTRIEGEPALQNGDWIVRRGRFVTFGMGEGTGDRIGYASIVVTPEMVGKRVAIFVSAEGKTGDDTMSAEQRTWHDQVRQAGGISVEVRDLDDIVNAIRAAAEGQAG